jgi:hypothetical protein
MNIDGENEGGEKELELPVHTEGPEEEVEIELTEEELEGLDEVPDEPDGEPDGEPEVEGEPAEDGEPEEAEVPEEPAEAPRRRSPDKRIADLSRRAQEAERRAQEFEAQLRQEAQLRRQSDIAMMTHYERTLTLQSASTKAALQEAKTVGDTEREIELQSELFQIQSNLSDVKTWRDGQEQMDSQPEPEPRPQSRPQAAAPVLEPRTREWIEKNEWFQPQTEGFDPEMHEEATIYARRIERRYRSEGRDTDIGGVEYFAEIDRHMRNEFPDAFAEQATPRKKTPQMSRNTPVAPVTRTGTPGQASRPSKTVSLSADERRMAHSLASSGAIKGKNGGRATPQEAERIYAIQKMNRR